MDLLGEPAEEVRVPSEVQRQFSWGSEEVATYWEDLLRFHDSSQSSDQYFVGPILTVWQEAWNYKLLLDGQQRLTTTTILLSVLRDAPWQLGYEDARVAARDIHRRWRTPTARA